MMGATIKGWNEYKSEQKRPSAEPSWPNGSLTPLAPGLCWESVEVHAGNTCHSNNWTNCCALNWSKTKSPMRRGPLGVCCLWLQCWGLVVKMQKLRRIKLKVKPSADQWKGYKGQLLKLKSTVPGLLKSCRQFQEESRNNSCYVEMREIGLQSPFIFYSLILFLCYLNVKAARQASEMVVICGS